MLSILLLAILGVATASSSHCVASSSDSYVCTENTGRAEEFDVGVAQRISGSPGETLLFHLNYIQSPLWLAISNK